MFLMCQLLRQLITEISKKNAISLLYKESPGLVQSLRGEKQRIV